MVVIAAFLWANVIAATCVVKVSAAAIKTAV